METVEETKTYRTKRLGFTVRLPLTLMGGGAALTEVIETGDARGGTTVRLCKWLLLGYVTMGC